MSMRPRMREEVYSWVVGDGLGDGDGGATGSSILSCWSALILARCCRMPLGQRMSIACATVSSPSPKCARLSLDERYEPVVLIVTICLPWVLVRVTSAPI